MDGLIAGLAGAMQGGGQALQQNAQMDMQRESSLAQARGLEEIRAQVMRDRESRVAEIIGSVKTTVDDPTHPEGSRQMNPRERAGAVAGALESKGLISEAKSYRSEENALRDDERQQSRYTAEADWRQRRADVEDKRADEAARHNRAAEGRAASAEGRAKSAEAERKAKAATNDGLVTGYLMSKRAGKEADAQTYQDEIIARGGKDPRGIAKDDPLSSQVAAAKAVLADFEATSEDKEAARAVLRMANESYTAKAGKPGSTQGAKEKPRYPDGTKLKKNGETYTVKNGVPVKD